MYSGSCWGAAGKGECQSITLQRFTPRGRQNDQGSGPPTRALRVPVLGAGRPARCRLLLSLVGLQRVPLLQLLLKQLVILLHVELQVCRKLVQAAEDLPRFLVELLWRGRNTGRRSTAP